MKSEMPDLIQESKARQNNPERTMLIWKNYVNMDTLKLQQRLTGKTRYVERSRPRGDFLEGRVTALWFELSHFTPAWPWPWLWHLSLHLSRRAVEEREWGTKFSKVS